MDPITLAILAAIAGGAVSGVTGQITAGAYIKLKELLGKKFGADSKVVHAMKELETNPKSEARKAVVKEEVVAVKADQDVELLKAAQELLKMIKDLPDGAQIIQTAIGDQNVQVAGDRNTVNMNIPKTKK